MIDIPKSLLAAVRYFSDLSVCNEYMRGIKWPDGICCHIRGRGAVGKRIVHGMLERGGEVRAKVVESTEAKELLPEVHANVTQGAMVCSDAHAAYSELWKNYIHEVIDHAQEYVRNNVHTNGMENFWSLLKRALKGTYVSVAPFHLQRYVDEQVHRYNHRKTDDGERFADVMKTVTGRRLTYRHLTAQDGCGFMGLE